MTAASTPKGERRRLALVEAAAALLADSGFDAVRHRAVAERAGLPLASTTYYFRSLDDLVMAAVEHGARAELAELRKALDGVGDDAGDDAFVELFLDALLGPRRTPEPDAAGSERASRADFDAVLVRYERFVAAARRPWLGPLMRELRAELDVLLADMARRFGRPAGADELARLVAVVDGAVISALIESHPDPRAAARRMLVPLL